MLLCEGEGGTFALFQGLYASETSNADISDIESQITLDAQKNRPKLSPKLRWPLLVWVRLECVCTDTIPL
jgi:hypothetical protein